MNLISRVHALLLCILLVLLLQIFMSLPKQDVEQKITSENFNFGQGGVLTTETWTNTRINALKPPIYLISIPKCGSKLTRAMVDMIQTECGSDRKIISRHAFLDDPVFGFRRFPELFLPETEIIFIVRDLKDALLSLANFYRKMMNPGPNSWSRLSLYLQYVLKPEPQLTEILNNWKEASLGDRLLWTIEDGSNTIHRNGWMRFLISETIESMKLHKEADVFWYEDLVGSKGRGDDDIKRNRLHRLVELLGGENCDHVINRLVNQSAQINTLTLNRGKIGDSRKVFKAKHVKLFNKLYLNFSKELGLSFLSQSKQKHYYINE